MTMAKKQMARAFAEGVLFSTYFTTNILRNVDFTNPVWVLVVYMSRATRMKIERSSKIRVRLRLRVRVRVVTKTKKPRTKGPRPSD